jgi:hypothetical protein
VVAAPAVRVRGMNSVVAFGVVGLVSNLSAQ